MQNGLIIKFGLDYFFLVNFVVVSYIIGEAINNDEYVPTITPTIIANMNPLIESPPKMKIDNNTMSVVNEVLMVLPRVVLKAVFTVLINGHDGCLPANSLILSKITTVSFNEYPTTVSSAAMNDWPISISNGNTFQNNEKIVNTINTS